MTVRTGLLATAPITASKTQAAIIGIDITGMLAEAELKCQEIQQILSVLNVDVFTPAGDTTAAGVMTTQSAALA
jgi:hypothetical protein